MIISSAYCVQHQHGCLVCRSLDCRSSFRVWRCTAEPQQLSALDESGVKRSTPRYQTMQAKQGNRAPLTCPSMVFRLEDGDLNSPQRGDILSEVSPSAFSPATAPLRRLWDGVGRKIKGNFVPRSGSFKLLLGKPWDRQLEPSVIAAGTQCHRRSSKCSRMRAKHCCFSRPLRSLWHRPNSSPRYRNASKTA